MEILPGHEMSRVMKSGDETSIPAAGATCRYEHVISVNSIALNHHAGADISVSANIGRSSTRHKDVALPPHLS